PARARGGADARARALPRAQAGAALRRRAAARRDGPRDRPRPERLPDGRTALEPRRQAARPDARRRRRAPARVRRDDRLRHPRPGGGDDARAPGGSALRRGAPAVRDAARALRPAHEHVRRRLHRLAHDEPLPGAAGDERRNLPRRGERRDRRLARGSRALERPRARPRAAPGIARGRTGRTARTRGGRRGARSRRVRVLCRRGRRRGAEARGAHASPGRAEAGRTRLAEPAPQRGASLRLGHRRAVGGKVTQAARGETFLAEIREQPQALLRLIEQASVYEEAARAAVERGPHIVRLVGHGSSDNAASYGVYAFGIASGWTALRDSISLSVYYGAKLELERSIVVALSQSGRTPDVVAYVQ